MLWPGIEPTSMGATLAVAWSYLSRMLACCVLKFLCRKTTHLSSGISTAIQHFVYTLLSLVELHFLEEPLPRKKLSKSFSEQEKIASISTSSFFVVIASFVRKKKKNFCGRIFPELSQLRSNFNDQLRNCFSNLLLAFNFPFRQLCSQSQFRDH